MEQVKQHPHSPVRLWNRLRKSWVFQVSAAVLLGLVLLGIILWNQLQPRWQQQHTPAFTIGGETVTTVTMNYYFRDAYDDFRGAFSQMSDADSPIDQTVSLDHQQYSEAGTWADFLFDTALSNALRTEAICAEAAAQHYDFDAKAAARETISGLRTRAAEQGYTSLTAFLRSFYGPTASEDSYTEYLQRRALAESYSQYIFDENQDQDAWDAWFDQVIQSQTAQVADTVRDGLYYAP